MSKHIDPEFFECNGFCRGNAGSCEACNELDAADLAAGMTQDEVIAKGLSLAIEALRKEES